LLAKFLRLPNADRRLLVRASMALVTAKLAVRAMSFISARKAVTSIQAIGGRPVAPPSPECIGWAVVTAGRFIPGLKNCLVQALAAEAILKRAGYTCELKIGATKNGPHELLAHAWLERDGKVFIGDFEPGRFRPLTAPGR
jgi:hypothetical protein